MVRFAIILHICIHNHIEFHVGYLLTLWRMYDICIYIYRYTHGGLGFQNVGRPSVSPYKTKIMC